MSRPQFPPDIVADMKDLERRLAVIERRGYLAGSIPADALAAEAWIPYTPTFVQGVTVTKTITYAKYTRIGRTIHFRVKLAATSAGTAGQRVTVGLPVACVDIDSAFGSAWLYDSSAGAVHRAITTPITTTAVVFAPTNNTVSDVLGVTGFTDALASGDIMICSGTYEAAS